MAKADSRQHAVLAALDAARDLFAERGFEGASIKDIAERAGVAAGTVMYHFRTKRNLLFVLARQSLHGLVKASRDRVAAARDKDEAALGCVDIFFEILRDRVVAARAYFKADPFFLLDRGHYPNADLDSLKRQYLGLFAELMPVADDPGRRDAAAQAVVAMLTGAARLVIVGGVNARALQEEIKRFVAARLAKQTLGNGS